MDLGRRSDFGKRWWTIGLWLVLLASAQADPVSVRIVAANLTSGDHQTYSPDNGNHSNPEGAGARILKGLEPDVALLQEFNTTVPVRQWVNATFGEDFAVFIEPRDGPGSIPNGIVSRWPIVESGEWNDDAVPNRDFAWAKIALPNGKFLWAISAHLYSKRPATRVEEARRLAGFVREKIPANDLVALGGDFNTASPEEACLRELDGIFVFAGSPPVDQMGDRDTNATRAKPYDWVLADPDLEACAVPTRIGGEEFSAGLVFDSRTFSPLSAVAPVRESDSAAPNMQHMAVVRDFVIP